MRTCGPIGWRPPRARLILLVCGLLFAANIFDLYHSLELGGMHAEEANPIMRFIMAAGPWVAWTVKITVSILVGAACALVILDLRVPLPWRRGMWIALCLLTAFYMCVVSKLVYLYLCILYPTLG